MPPDTEAIAEQVFVALADPTRRAILAALASGGPATATDLAGRLPITRQAIAKHLALLAEAGLVMAEPGERRRVRYRLRSAPMQVAQQFLAALARDWDGPLGALRDHLDQRARGPGTTTTPPRDRGRGPERKGEPHDGDARDRHAAGVGGGAPATAGQGEGTDPGPGRAGRAAAADAVAGGGEDL
jgi:DNA-binding transcriptional ArsR family regulator